MKVRWESAVNLLERCGYANASRYTPTVMVRRLEAIETAVPDVIKLTVTEPSAKRLMNVIMSAVKQGDRVELLNVPQEKVEVPHVTVTEKPDDQAGAEDVAAGGADDPVPAADVRGRGHEPGKGYVRKTRGGGTEEFPGHLPAARPSHRHGTVKRTIFEELRSKGEGTAITKDELFGVIRAKFPDNSEAALRHVVNAFPHWLPLHYPFWIRQTDKAYWLEPALAPKAKKKSKQWKRKG